MGRTDARRLTALLDKNEQIRHILDGPPAVNRAARAFVVTGDYYEWPEAIIDKLMFRLDGKTFPPGVDLRLTRGRYWSRNRATGLLFDSLAKVLHQSPMACPDPRDVASWLAEQDCQLFYLKISAADNPDSVFLAELVHTWETLPLSGRTRYLLLVVYSVASKGFWLRRWWHGLRLARLARRIRRSLKKQRHVQAVLPRLQSLDLGHVVDWLDEPEYSPHWPDPGLPDRLREHAEALFEKKAKIPHRELAKALYPLLDSGQTVYRTTHRASP